LAITVLLRACVPLNATRLLCPHPGLVIARRCCCSVEQDDGVLDNADTVSEISLFDGVISVVTRY